MTGSRIVGPALGGLLVATVGFGWAFLLDGLSYTAVLVGLWLMRTEDLRPSPVATRAKGQVREGLRYARSVPELWVPLAMMALVGTLSYNFQTVFPLFTTRDLGGSGATFTTLFSIVSVGALVGALAVARRRRISIRAVAGSAFAYGVALAFMAVAPNQGIAFALGPLLGLASIAFLTASTAIVQIEAAPEMRGRVLALQAMLFLGSTPVGGPIVGFVSERWGARYGIGIGAAAALTAGAFGLHFARRHAARAIAAPDAEVTVLDGVGELAVPAGRAAS
jgi:predicted MFS family arabinose efflux permease